jgi:hypothetical protein
MLLAILIALAISRQPAPEATFEVDLWPGEGVPIFEAAAPQLRLYEQPSTSSSLKDTAKVRRGQRLSFDETRFRTTKPGQFLVLTSTTVVGRTVGAVGRVSRPDYYSGKFGSARVAVKAGDRIEYLQYRAEGTCFVRSGGSVIEADPCPTGKPAEFRLEAKPVTEWWIQVIQDGKPRGWLLITDATAKVVARTF